MLTGVAHLCAYVCRQQNPHRFSHKQLTNDDVVDLNHLVMSFAMLLMVWMSMATIFNWLQVIVFTAFGLLVLSRVCWASGATQRLDLFSHVLMDLAMIWMLFSMPMLMGHMHAASPHMAAGLMHSSSHTNMLMPPADRIMWVNHGVIGCSVLVGLWWLSRVALATGHRFHGVRHATMAAAMAVMLVLMAR